MCKKDPFKKPVIQKDCVAIACGLLKSAAVITPGGPDDAYVELMKSSPWLCQAVTGVCYKSGPLGRTRLLEAFKVEMKKAEDFEMHQDQTDAPEPVPAKNDKMNLLFANTPAPAAKIEPISARAYRKKNKTVCSKSQTSPTKGKSPTKASSAKTIKHPLHFGGQELAEWRLWRKGGSDVVWLHVDDLVAAVEYLHAEAMNQGVPPSTVDGSELPALAVDDGLSDNGGSCSWCRRDYMWQVRCKGKKTQEIHRRNFKVAMKSETTSDRLSIQEFVDAKQVAHKAAMEWMEHMKEQ